MEPSRRVLWRNGWLWPALKSMWAISLILAFGIGLSLGLLGSGGSIVTLPVLVYVAGLPVTAAVGMSLAIVGGTSAVGAWWKHRKGMVHRQAAALFGGTGIVGALLGAQGTPLVPPALLMLLFAGVMGVIAVRMLAQRGDEAVEPLPDCRPWRCGMAGLAVGLLTGFLGVGGGFLLVPAMIHFGRLPMAIAVGTSLAVIAANSLAGWLGHLRHGDFDATLALPFLMLALLGMTIGIRLGRHLSPATLRRSFGWFILLVAGWVLAKNWQTFTGGSPSDPTR